MILNNNTKHIATIKKVYYPSGNTNYCLILSQTHKALFHLEAHIWSSSGISSQK